MPGETVHNLSYTGQEVDQLLDKINELGEATPQTAGLMSAADKTKLNGVSEGAEENVIESISVGGEQLAPADKNVDIPVDEEPTADSKNLISSGAVFAALGQSGMADRLIDTRSNGVAQSFAFRQSGGDGVDYLKRIKGRTLVWNQLVQNGDFSTNTGWRAGASGTSLAYGTKMATLTCNDSQNASGVISQPIGLISGHTYIVTYDVKCSKVGNYFGGYLGSPTQWFPSFDFTGQRQTISVLITAAADKNYLYIGPYKNSAPSSSYFTNGDTVEFYSCYLTDLTLLGWVPSSVSEFRAVYPLSYYSYTPALLINNAATDLESTGWNCWDEIAENGEIDPITGANSGNLTTYYRSKNYIPVIAERQYFFLYPRTLSTSTRVFYYDAEQNFISYANIGSGGDYMFTTPTNCGFVRFRLYNASEISLTSHDICINLSDPSDPSRNGTYEPYWKATRHLGLDSIQAKEVGTDTIVTINGLDGVGDNVDLLKDGKYLTKNRARVDLGSLTWNKGWYTEAGGWRIYCSIQNKANGLGNLVCSRYAYLGEPNSSMSDKSITGNIANSYIYIKDSSYSGSGADALIASLSGVILDYPLATPKEYELVNPITPYIEVDEDGTEKRLPEDTAAAPQAPFESDSNYSISIANLVRKLNA